MKKIMFIVTLLVTTFTACQKNGIAPEKNSSTLTVSTKSTRGTNLSCIASQLNRNKASITPIPQIDTPSSIGAGNAIYVKLDYANLPGTDLVALELLNSTNSTVLILPLPGSTETITVKGNTYPVVAIATLPSNNFVIVDLPGSAVLDGIGYGNIYKIKAVVFNPKGEIITSGELNSYFTIVAPTSD